ncbi:AraC family transcriptional regulator [Kordiimonas sp. SCSIO 12610]|uniref:helix-turn-helix domain-containing protein n=1 Tax=Kordiimonas sp. SCSIO 12610 TaxID=2829597 RepID=UPI00210EE3BB|nr:AraC family transcriptional regulator [Kordiimonas sp. SCSIO 12610]UTW54620.1 helix-turn-helix transcriptional regulator [Kordiimonas sp. SCSIO 12610]
MQFIPFTSAILLAIIAGSLYRAPSAYQYTNRILAGLLAVLSMQMFGLTARLYEVYLEAYIFNSVLAMCVGPLIYLYLYNLTKGRMLLKARYMHVLPALVSPLVFFFTRNTQIIPDIFILISLIAYSLLSAQLLLYNNRKRLNELPEHIRRFALFCLTFLFVLTAMDLLIYFEISFLDDGHAPVSLVVVSFVFALVSLFSAWSLLNRADAVAWVFKRKYEAAPIDTKYSLDSHREVIAKLDNLIMKEQIHLNSETNLKSLAEALGAPERLVSNAINQKYNKTIRRFINDLRIEEAQKQLVSSNEDILSIMLNVGYETKSNFYREFHNTVGCSPNEYRKKQKT